MTLSRLDASIVCWAVVGCAAIGVAAQAPSGVAFSHYTACNGDGSRGGELVISTEPSGDTVARHQCKNNGRGPETVERFRLGPDGTPLAYQVSGSSTYGSAIVPLVAGTDHTPGIVLHSELIGYAQAGISLAQVLQIATRNGARYSGTESDRGAIAPGMRADLILVDGEPTERMADIRRVALVITQGRWLAPRDLHQAIGMQPFVDATPTVRRLAAP